MRSKDLPRINEFEVKPEGACRADICIPIPKNLKQDDWFNFSGFAHKVGAAVVADSGVWSFGEIPLLRRGFLNSRTAPDFAVPDRAAGDSLNGCRQMIGNVWEWTASDFLPYPGFEVDPYKEYSEPWFGSERKVLRGGCWATRSRLIRNTWRNYFPKDRRDVFAGFRTCALPYL